MSRKYVCLPALPPGAREWYGRIKRMGFLAYPSGLVLVMANLLPLWFALAGRWDAFHVLLAYWWEGVIIAILAILKVEHIRSQASRKVRDEFDIYDAPPAAYLFIVGALTVIHLWLIGSLAVSYDGDLATLGKIFTWQPGRVFDWLGTHAVHGSVLIFATVILASHAFSWYNNFIARREFVHVRMLLDRSVIRIVVPQLLAIMLALVSLNSSFFPLWGVVAGKTLADLLIHLVERMTANPGHGSPQNDEVS